MKKPGRKTPAKTDGEELKTLSKDVENFDGSDLAKLKKFDELPISRFTRKGLRESHFVNMTEIQKQAIVPALKGQDILGAARTGSGKTLAFLIPILEKLYREKWTQLDGLGALVISPTRELAEQTFAVLRKIGKSHGFSAGLLIGGKNVKEEKARVGRLNILIATPGRLLQHMDESPQFDATNLQVLVLDEADRILDMGFRKTLDAIVENLSSDRQTMLFSATQTKTVNDLARLSLDSPTYISVDAESVTSTPKNLDQYYTTLSVGGKLDMLWSFLRTHTQSKILVFFASSKQVRFTYEGFRRMQPGIPLLQLHGRLKQTSRSEQVEKFSKARASCLFATDVVARGIDFPEIDWVIQVDCPEDTATYIHRVGRSARAGKSGNALLMLTESEESVFVSSLKARKVPIQKLTVKEAKKTTIQPELQAQCFQDPELKYLAQKAFISYVRSIYLQKDKETFNVEAMDVEALAKSFGLASAPNVTVKGGKAASSKKNQPRALREPEPEKPEKVRTKYDRMFERQNQNVLSEHYQKMVPAEESDDEFMTVTRKDHEIDDGKTPSINIDLPESKRAAKRALSKKASLNGNPTKLVFDDDGTAHPLYELENEEDFHKLGDAESQRMQFVEKEAEEMVDRDELDKEVLKERRQEKKRKRKEMERLAREGADSDDEGAGVVAMLPSASEGEDEAEYSRFDGFGNDSDSDNEVDREPKSKRPAVLEVAEPETLADLEALSAQLLRN